MRKHFPIPVIDLFAGPGGLGEGFSACTHHTCEPAFKIRLSVEKEKSAHQTLRLRSFYRQFPRSEVPNDYYECLRTTLTMQELFAKYPAAADAAEQEAWLAELGNADTPPDEIHHRISKALDGASEWVLIGGPPCQAYSLAGRSRNKTVENYSLESDPKHSLYTEYLQIISDHWPSVFVMENVPGLLSASVHNQSMFERIVSDLEAPSSALSHQQRRSHRYNLYSLVHERAGGTLRPSDFIVRAELYGVPQARHRVIIVGVRDDLGDTPPTRLTAFKEKAQVGDVLRGLPRLRAGLSREPDSDEQWRNGLQARVGKRWLSSAITYGSQSVHDLICTTLKELALPRHGRGSEFIDCDVGKTHVPEWFHDDRLGGVCNHVTRAHIIQDLYRYLYAACFAQEMKRSPKLCDFPADLLPNHANVSKAMGNGYFAERFRVQRFGEPATTITSHLAKDGHHFIHPDPGQCRSLTVREAARLQTFPDNYLFVGTRTQQYTQVGNAVPPLLARQIADRVLGILTSAGVCA